MLIRYNLKNKYKRTLVNSIYINHLDSLNKK